MGRPVPAAASASAPSQVGRTSTHHHAPAGHVTASRAAAQPGIAAQPAASSVPSVNAAVLSDVTEEDTDLEDGCTSPPVTIGVSAVAEGPARRADRHAACYTHTHTHTHTRLTALCPGLPG